MLMRRLCQGLPADEQGRHDARAGMIFLSLGMMLNTLAILANRFGRGAGIEVPDFFLGMMTGAAVVLLLVSVRFTARSMRRR